MRSFAIARTSAQWAQIAEEMYHLCESTPAMRQLRDDIGEMLVADMSRGPVPDLPEGIVGDVHFARLPEDRAFAERFPEAKGVVSSHYDQCWKSHSWCAYRAGFSDAITLATSAPATKTY